MTKISNLENWMDGDRDQEFPWHNMLDVYRIPGWWWCMLESVSSLGMECKRIVETGFGDLELVKS